MYKAVLYEKLISGDPQQIVLSFTYMGTLPTANPAYTPFVTCVAEYKSSKFDFLSPSRPPSPSVAAAAKIMLLLLPIQNLFFSKLHKFCHLLFFSICLSFLPTHSARCPAWTMHSFTHFQCIPFLPNHSVLSTIFLPLLASEHLYSFASSAFSISTPWHRLHSTSLLNICKFSRQPWQQQPLASTRHQLKPL